MGRIRLLFGCGLLFYNIVSAQQPFNDYHYYEQWENGIPADSTFFPIGVWCQPTNRAAEYRSCGINVYVSVWGNVTETHLTQLKAADMKLINYQNGVALTSGNNDVIVGWLQPDEPDLAKNGSSCTPTRDIINNYNNIRAADSTRPVLLGLSRGVAYTSDGARGDCSNATWMYPEYIQGCDIASFDVYPVVSTEPTIMGNLWYVPKGVDSLHMWADYQKPVWCAVEGTHIASEEFMATPAELKTEIWMALIHGATGFLYFCHEWYPSFSESAWLARYPEMNNAITTINNEIHDLAPVLYSPTVYDAVSDSGSWRSPVDMMVKVHGGYTYLFAVIMRKRADTKKFTLAGLPENATAEVIGEDRSISVIDGSFTDDFEAYGLHLYKIDAPVNIDDVSKSLYEKIECSIQVTPQPCRGELTIRLDGNLEVSSEISIHTMEGRLIRSIQGNTWDGRNETGREAAAGLYQIRVKTNKSAHVKPFILMR